MKLYSKLWVYSYALSTKYLGGSAASSPIPAVINAIIVSIITLPIEIIFKSISTFYIEEKHGFNKQTVLFFAKDQLKSALLGLVMNSIFTYFTVKAIILTQPNFIFSLTIVIIVLMLAVLTIMPNYILPIFDKFIPLPESWPLRGKIVEMMARHRFPMSEVSIQTSSLRSAHSNAYFIGNFYHKMFLQSCE